MADKIEPTDTNESIELVALRKEVADLRLQIRSGKLDPILAEQVRIRMGAGLSYEDALHCARKQMAHDERLAKLEEANALGAKLSPLSTVHEIDAALSAKKKK